ncbi:MAG TPA: SDR family oxidoreductase, partial [Solirubrobacteraceae bacterium]|nr:SDR family oxidoreductase [Solirubrobacteraceae bacterium]
NRDRRDVRRVMTVLKHRRGQPLSLSNQVIAITGGARGIGHATAQALARRGARVAIGDLDGDLAARVAAELGGHAFGVGVDVTDNAAFTAFLDGVEHRLGPLDVLVNNAGIMNAGPIDAEDEALTARAIAINLEAVIHGTREAVQRMKPRGTGHIVNVSSAVSRVAGSHCATYVATKFAVAGFSEAVAIELRGTGVEMSVVRPSLCHTDLASGFAGLRGMPFIEPQDVAERIVETLRRPRFDVPVPKSMGPMLWLNQALPFRARLALAHLTKADEILSHIDADERAAYVERVKASA